MDQERQIRFLYPPFFLLASLLLGLGFDPSRSLSDILPVVGSDMGVNEIVGLIAGGSALVLASGFLIGAVSVLFLRLLFFLLGKGHYEAGVSAECLSRIWKRLDTPEPLSKSKALYAVATFDHELLPKSIHDWVGRRWSAFNISVHSCTALVLALIVGRLVSITVGPAWIGVTSAAFLVLACNAFFARHDTMAMIEFQSHRHSGDTEDDIRKGNGA